MNFFLDAGLQLTYYLLRSNEAAMLLAGKQLENYT